MANSVKKLSAKTIHRLNRSRPAQVLRRYTSLAATIHLLQKKCITLIGPDSWDDKNDAHFMAEYKRITSSKTVLAICLAESGETYHHWRVFSPSSDGVCVEFDKKRLLHSCEGIKGLAHRKMEYLLIDTLKKKKKDYDAELLPFLKRRPYEDEKEYRIVYRNKDTELHSKEVAVELSSINRITLSPWIHPTLRDSIQQTLKSIPGCSGIRVARSTLVGNDEWRSMTSNARVKRRKP